MTKPSPMLRKESHRRDYSPEQPLHFAWPRTKGHSMSGRRGTQHSIRCAGSLDGRAALASSRRRGRPGQKRPIDLPPFLLPHKTDTRWRRLGCFPHRTGIYDGFLFGTRRIRAVGVSFTSDDRLRRVLREAAIHLRQVAKQVPRPTAGNEFFPVRTKFRKGFDSWKWS